MARLSIDEVQHKPPTTPLSWIAAVLSKTVTGFEPTSLAISTGLGTRTDAIMRIFGVMAAHDRPTAEGDWFIGLYSTPTGATTDFRSRNFIYGFESMVIGAVAAGYTVIENQYHTRNIFLNYPILYADDAIYVNAVTQRAPANVQVRIYYDIVEVDAATYFRVKATYT